MGQFAESEQEHRTTYDGVNSRRRGRMRVIGVFCPLGDVNDISARGMRLTTRGKPKFRLDDKIHTQLVSEAGGLEVSARIVWMQKVGLRRFEVGLEFDELTKEAEHAILDLTRIGGAGIYL